MTKRERFTGDQVSIDDSISFERDGLTVRATIMPDYDADTSWIGEFSDTPEEGAIDHHATGTWLGRSHRGPRYFNTANYAYKDYLSMGKTKSVARRLANKQAQQDYKRMVGYYTGEWDMVGVKLTVSRDGVTLGEASLWGIESDSGSYFNEVVEDLLHDAMAGVKERLKLLTAFAATAAL